MTAHQVTSRNDGIVLETQWPYDTKWWQKLWTKPWSQGGQIPALDAVFSASGRGRVHTLRFSSNRTLPTNLRAGSNLIPFGAGQKLLRQHVIEVFGKPEDFFESSGSGVFPPGITTNLPASLMKGHSVSWSNMADETLYFPTNGIIFNLRAGTVDTVQIVGKVALVFTNSSRR